MHVIMRVHTHSHIPTQAHVYIQMYMAVLLFVVCVHVTMKDSFNGTNCELCAEEDVFGPECNSSK